MILFATFGSEPPRVQSQACKSVGLHGRNVLPAKTVESGNLELRDTCSVRDDVNLARFMDRQLRLLVCCYSIGEAKCVLCLHLAECPPTAVEAPISRIGNHVDTRVTRGE